MSPARVRSLAAAFVLLVGGCALTSKSTPVEIRYFSPEAPRASLTSGREAGSAAATEGRPRVRLGRITSSAHLRTKIVVRHSPVELGTYEDRRWTENPEAYLRRSLESALFDDGRLVQTMAGGTPTLDVELVGFEEVRRGTARAGRVELVYTLHDEQDVIASDRLAIERDARSGEMSDVVAAIAAAMSASTYEVEKIVSKRLGAGAAPR